MTSAPRCLSLLALVALAVPIRAQPPAPGGAPQLRATIATPDPQALRGRLETLGYDVGHGTAAGVEVFLSVADLQALAGAGLAPEVHETGRPLRQVLGPEPEGVPAGYRDPAAISAALASTAATHPGLAMTVDAAAVYGPGATFEGRPIEVIKISDNVTQDEDEPNVLIVAAHHSREIVTPEIALYVVEQLTMGYGTDPQVTALVDAHEIWVAPVWNPDGLHHVWNVNNFWRKNRKPFGSDVGVDLNRNYPFDWSAPCGGSTDPSSNTYRGPSAASEEETQTMVGLAQARHFAKVVDMHSSGLEVRQGYACSPIPQPIADLQVAEAGALAQTMGYSVAPSCCAGGHFAWEILRGTSYSFLFETATSFQPPHAAALAEAQTVWPGILAFLQRPISVRGHVTDAATGLPVVADVTVGSVAWQLGEVRRSEPQFGRYHLFLPDGTWQVTFDALTYVSQTHTLTVSSGAPVTLEVSLVRGFHLDFATTGGGVGDLHVQLGLVPPATTEGFTLVSLDTQAPVGQGTVLGIRADLLTLQLIATPAAPGNPFHWTHPAPPGLFPAAPFDLPPGTLTAFSGVSVDAQGVAVIGAFPGTSLQTTLPRRITL